MKNLSHHLLIAPPNMQDERFAQSVIYIASHDKDGALGFIINKPLPASMLDIFQDIDIPYATSLSQLHTKRSVLDGGPVMPEVGFILHTGLPNWHSSQAVTENVCFTTSRDILDAIAQENSIAHYYMCLGHAGWEAQQLENEIADGDWFVTKATPEFLFELPLEERWHSAGLKAGVDFNWMTDSVGNA